MLHGRSAVFGMVLLLLALAAPGAGARAGEADEANGLRVKCMSFNIRYGTADDGPDHWRHRKGMVVEMIDEHGGDFVGLQEALRDQIDTIREHVPRYGEVGVGRDDGEDAGEFSSILYDTRRWRLDPEEHGTFWLSDTPEVIASRTWGNQITRIVTWARFIDEETGRGVYVFNSHWDHQSQPSREKSAELMARRAADRTHADEPLILTGDFNAGEDNPAIEYLRGEAEDAPLRLVDTFRVVRPDAEEVGTFNGFEFGRTGGAKIDYIMVEPTAEVLDADIHRDARDGHYPSDHFPVTAELVFSE